MDANDTVSLYIVDIIENTIHVVSFNGTFVSKIGEGDLDSPTDVHIAGEFVCMWLTAKVISQCTRPLVNWSLHFKLRITLRQAVKELLQQTMKAISMLLTILLVNSIDL